MKIVIKDHALMRFNELVLPCFTSFTPMRMAQEAIEYGLTARELNNPIRGYLISKERPCKTIVAKAYLNYIFIFSYSAAENCYILITIYDVPIQFRFKYGCFCKSRR